MTLKISQFLATQLLLKETSVGIYLSPPLKTAKCDPWLLLIITSGSYVENICCSKSERCWQKRHFTVFEHWMEHFCLGQFVRKGFHTVWFDLSAVCTCCILRWKICVTIRQNEKNVYWIAKFYFFFLSSLFYLFAWFVWMIHYYWILLLEK